HVFGAVRVSGSAEVVDNWEQIKAAEARGQGGEPPPVAAFARVPEGLPALLRAQRLGEKAARAGFDGAAFADIVGQVGTQVAGLEKDVRAIADSGAPGATPTE